MANRVSFGTVQGGPIEPPSAESPFRIALLADFSGRQARGAVGAPKDIAARRPIHVSRENLDEVMSKLKVHLRLPFGDGDAVVLTFTSLDDFHPDRIHDKVIHVSDAADLGQKCAWMNWILHHPEFQALESTWRGLDWLLGRAAKGKVEVLILDVSFAELAGDLKLTENLSKTALHWVLINNALRGAQVRPWGAFVANYVFELSASHAELLGRLANIAGQANAPFLATVDAKVLHPSLRTSPDDAGAWQALRQLPEAALLGLSAPRFLLRPPYSDNNQSIDRFSFEEMSVPPDRSHYLWGASALGCAALVAQAFHKAGWAGKPGSVLDLSDMFLHVYSQDGEEEVTQTETWLARPQAEHLVKKGIMPFLCVKGKASLQLSRIHSLALPPKDQPACDLQGHWGKPDLAPMPPQRSGPPPGVKVNVTAERAGPSAPGGQASLSPLDALEADAARHRPPVTAAPAHVSPLAAVDGDRASVAPAAPATPAHVSPLAAVDDDRAAAAPAADAPPAEEEMDPDLAALLKSLE